MAGPLLSHPKPRQGSTARLDHLVDALPYIVLVAVALQFALLGWSGTAYSPDSFSYYDLARNVLDGPFRVDTIRQFQNPSEFGNSFPPAWPVLIAIGDLVTQLDIRTGLILNVALVVFAGLLAERLVRRHFGVRGYGAVSVVAFCGWAPFASEILGGRAIPASLCLLLIVLLQLPVDTQRARPMAILGALLGAMVLVRFDWLWPALLTPILFAFVSKRRLLPLAACYGALVLVLLPWVTYSLVHFDTPFASDNSRQALDTETLYVTDYAPSARVTALDDPVAWGERVVGNVKFAAEVLPGVASRLLLVLLPLLACLCIAYVRRRGSLHWPTGAGQSALVRQALVIGALVLIHGAFPALVVRYGAPRYWALPVFGVLLAVCVVIGLLAKQRPERSRVSLAAVVAVVAGAVTMLLNGPLDDVNRISPSFDDGAGVRAAVDPCVASDEGVMVLGDGRLAAQLGALSEQASLFQPANLRELTPSAVRTLVTDFDVRHVLVRRDPHGAHLETLRAGLGSRLTLEPCGVQLYRVAR